MLEQVREEIARKACVLKSGLKLSKHGLDMIQFWDFAKEALDTKLGSHTLKEIIQMIDDKKLVKLSENQDLPENPYHFDTNAPFAYMEYTDEDYAKLHTYTEAQQDMLKAGFRKVEPL